MHEQMQSDDPSLETSLPLWELTFSAETLLCDKAVGVNSKFEQKKACKHQLFVFTLVVKLFLYPIVSSNQTFIHRQVNDYYG